MKFAAALVITLLVQNPPVAVPSQDAGTAVLEGTVVRAGSGEPIAGAQVVLTSSLSPLNMFNGPSPIPPVISDSNGNYSFKELKAASYRIAVTANGYVRQEYGQKVLSGSGTGRTIYLTAGQTLKDLSIPLTPAATVTGRILNDAGQPAPEILVQLAEETYSLQGRSYRGVGMANADDRGEYRIYGVTPGLYYLVAGNVQVLQTIAPGAGDAISIRLSRGNYAPQFYPGAPDIAAASRVELKPGSEFRADFTVKQQVGYRVSGTVIDPATGQPATDARINLSMLRNPQAMIQPMLMGTRNTGAAGTFEFLNVPPGEFAVRAEIPVQIPPTPGPPDPATSAVRNSAQASRPVVQVPIHITNADVDGMVLTLSRGFTVPGKIIVDGASISTVPNLDRLNISFRASENGVLTQTTIAASPAISRPAPDGTFQLDGVRPGEYLIVVNAPPGFYLNSARYGEDDVLYNPIRFSTPGPGGIELTLRAGAGQISGTVTDSKSQPVAGIQAVLIPESSHRNRSELYKTATTDQNGRFTMLNIAPGNYKIFSWEAIAQNGYYDPNLLKRYESQGREILVEESSNKSADVKMIPAE